MLGFFSWATAGEDVPSAVQPSVMTAAKATMAPARWSLGRLIRFSVWGIWILTMGYSSHEYPRQFQFPLAEYASQALSDLIWLLSAKAQRVSHAV
jgi:hypothetical protein